MVIAKELAFLDLDEPVSPNFELRIVVLPEGLFVTVDVGLIEDDENLFFQ